MAVSIFPTMLSSLIIGSGLLVASIFTSTESYSQQTVSEFYKGKQIRFIIRSAPGGGYDLYSRLLSAHIVRHIPGRPTTINNNMPGAGGLQAANFVGELAPQDGTILTMVSQALPLDQALGLTPQLTTDLSKFGWIGNLGDSNLLTYVWHTSATQTFEDAKKRETTLGGSGAGSVTTWLPLVYNNVLNTKFTMVNGYKSANDVRLAMERGEVEGYAANPWNALMTTNPELVRDKKLKFLVQIGLRRESDLPDVPLLTELAGNEDQKLVLEFITKAFAVGRPIATTPNVPSDRLNALRKAFADTVRDPIFLTEAKKIGAEIDPIFGDEIERMMNDVINAPPATKAKVRAAMPQR